jgi:hypothetical protein
MIKHSIRPTIYFLSFIGADYSRSSTILNFTSKEFDKKFLKVESGFFGIYRSLSENRKELKKARAIIIMSPCHMIAPLARIVLRKPIILDAGWSLTDGILSRGINVFGIMRLLRSYFLDLIAFHISQQILFESKAQLRRSRKIFRLSEKKSLVQYTGLDESKFRKFEVKSALVLEVEKKLEAIKNPLTVIFRGKVNNESGFSIILEAARRMNGTATFIFVIGFKDECLDPPENVVIVKEITNSEMHYLYKFSDIAIGQFSDHPRLRYTIPHKAFEAGFYSKCYISADSIGVREIFDEESAVFLEEISSDSLESAISSLVSKSLRQEYSENIKKSYLRNHSQELISKRFDQIVIELLSHLSK